MRSRSLRLLWTARTVSILGDSLSLVALMLHVADTTGRAFAVALLLLAGDFAPALLGPLTGAVSDRFDLKRVMLGCEVLAGAVMVVIALWLPSLPALLILVALRSTIGYVFQPASRAAIPALASDQQLERANAAIGIGTNGGEALGPLLAGLLVPVLGVRSVLLIDAGTFAVSLVLLSFLRLPARAPPSGPQDSSFWQDTVAGLRYIWATPLVRTIGLGFFAIVACNGIDDVALVFLATGTLGGGDSGAGILLAAVGIGLLLGYLLLARKHPQSMPALLLAGFAISSAGNLLTGLAWALAAAFVVQTLRGVGIAAMDVAVNTLLQRIVPGALLGRVFGSLYGAIGVGAALAYVLGGLLLDATTPRVTFVVAGAAGLLATLAAAASIRRSAPSLPSGVRAALTSGDRDPAGGLVPVEARLDGGNVGGAVLVGGTVRRPTGSWTPAVHALLDHLERGGFDGAPRVLGIDEQRREILTYLAGTTVGASRPWPAWVHSDDALRQVGRWLRSYHDAVADFVPPADAQWRASRHRWQPGDVVGHNDAGPYNAVWREQHEARPDAGRLIGFIDWDFAAPGPALHDLAFVAFSWVPLTARDVAAADGFTDYADRPRRLRLLLDAYGHEGDIDGVLHAVKARIIDHTEGLRTLAASGDPPFVQLVQQGVIDDLDRAIAQLDQDADDFRTIR